MAVRHELARFFLYVGAIEVSFAVDESSYGDVDAGFPVELLCGEGEGYVEPG